MNEDKNFLLLAAQSLAESIDQRSMIHLAREIVSDYSLNKNSELPDSLEMPRIETAKTIINDMSRMKLLIPFLNVFFSIHFSGYKGRQYKISRMRELLVNLYNMGFSLDQQSGRLYEDPQFRVSRNWGVLRENHDYAFSFLWTDIVHSSIHVKKNTPQKIKNFYNLFNKYVRQAVESRNGRVWHIEGDGILSAFHFGNHAEKAFYAALEILNRMFDYNRFESNLASPVEVRITLNNGISVFTENHEDLKKNDLILKTIELEKYTKPQSITLTLNLAVSLSGVPEEVIQLEKEKGHPELYSYSLRWEK